MYKVLVAKMCDGCSTAPLTKNKNNEIYQEITEEDKGYTDELENLNRYDSGLTVTTGLKEAAAKKLRLGITGYSQAEYWYLLSNKGYITSYKNYNISKADEA